MNRDFGIDSLINDDGDSEMAKAKFKKGKFEDSELMRCRTLSGTCET